MFPRLLPAGGPRPADPLLPVTLLPNPMASMAPPRPRRLSLLSACLLYGLVAAGGHWMTLRMPSASPVRPLETRPDRDYVTVPLDPTHARPAVPPPVPGRAWLPSTLHDSRPALAPQPDSLPEDYVAKGFATEDLSTRGLDAAKLAQGLQPTVPGMPPVPPATPVAEGSRNLVVDYSFQQMQVLRRVEPVYPPLCRRAKVQGAVELLLTVDEAGRVAEVQVTGSPHPALAAEAERAARLWRFQPATLNGQPVGARFRLTLVFRLT